MSSNAPQIRFKGFSEDWEERKFGDLGTVAMCKRIFKEQTTDKGDVPFYKIGTFGGEPDAFISRELYEEYKLKFSYPEVGDMLISASGTIGRIVEYTGKDEYFQDSNIVWFKHDERVVNSFLKCLYSIVKWSEIEGSTIKRLYNDNFLKTEFMLPSFNEQQKIGSYFRSLDTLITLQQRKLDNLKQLKKAMLQKMFPRNGSRCPEVRFKGFSGDWEERKLSEISDKVSKKNQDMEVDEVFTNSAEYGIISQRDYFDKDIANSENIGGYYIVEPDDFVYNPRISTFAPFGPIRRNKLEKSGAMSPLYYVFRTHDIDCGYLEYYFKTNNWYSFMHLNGNSGVRSDRFAIRDDVFKGMPIIMPQNIEEQQQIGSYFRSLDKLITLQQRKSDNLKQLKKAMLQKMFV